MLTYFKNTELAEQYGISEATVRNWIKQSKAGKIPFKLVSREGSYYVANDASNIFLIQNLIKQNQKYRNKLSVKIVRPNPKFYEVFNEAQIYDIARSLECHSEIPFQYNYFSAGAHIWNEYIEQRLKAGTPSVITRTIELLADSYSYIDKRLEDSQKVNLIDVGVGNAEPAMGMIDHLLKQNKLNRYVGIDFSQDMLDLAQKKIFDRFGNRVEFQSIRRDITHERFSDIFVEDYISSARDVLNVVLFLGSTPNNLRVPEDAFRTIYESMNPKDILVYTGKLAPENALPEWFEHEFKRGDLRKPELTRQDRLVLDLLGVKEPLYDIEIGYDRDKGLRYARTRFKVAVEVVIDFEYGQHTVSFKKGDSILLWRAWRKTSQSLFKSLEDSGFYIMQSSQSDDRNYILTISEVGGAT